MGRYLDKILQEWIKNEKKNIEKFEIRENPSDDMFDDYQISIVSSKNSFYVDERSKGL